MEHDSDSEIDSDSNNGQISRSGKIHSIEIHDFMTFSEVTVFPGENLNLLIGPNGTGKSSIVSAMVLGMGGNAKVLSAHLKLGAYVKIGKEKAKITTKLYKNEKGDTQSFTRVIGTNNKSVYEIDGSKVTETDFLHTVHELKIQVR